MIIWPAGNPEKSRCTYMPQTRAVDKSFEPILVLRYPSHRSTIRTPMLEISATSRRLAIVDKQIAALPPVP
jgi:hypothetical protein